MKNEIAQSISISSIWISISIIFSIGIFDASWQGRSDFFWYISLSLIAAAILCTYLILRSSTKNEEASS
jgi:hypothetical protein